MSIRGGGAPREPIAAPPDGGGRRPNGYQRTGRYGRGPGDQDRYARYNDSGGGLGGVLRFLIFLVILAVAVLLLMATVARPIVRMVVVPWAEDNPSALRISFVADLVREDLGASLIEPAGTDPTEVEFTVAPGDTPTTLAPRLQQEGLIADQRAFLFEARMAELTGKLNAGKFLLAATLTPAGIVDGLVNNRVVAQTINVTFREGLRIEQMTAKLSTLDTGVDPAEFQRLATEPPDSILADFPWILNTDVRPKGASLEGFLYPATYTLKVDGANQTTADDLIRMMLSAFYDTVGQARLDVPEKRGLTFYQVLTMASIVEREAVLDEERALIAGVYQNRLNPKMWPTALLQSDPTIFYRQRLAEVAEAGARRLEEVRLLGCATEGVQLPTPLPD